MNKLVRFFSLLLVFITITTLLCSCSGNGNESFPESDHISVDTSIQIDNSENSSESIDISEDNSDFIDVSEDNSTTDVSGDVSQDESSKESQVLFDSSFLSGSSPFLPSYAPFSLYDTTLFSDTVITSISFPFASLASGYSVDSDGLIMPVYIIKSDFTSKRGDCTVENGKKIELDFTGKLDGVKAGDWLTADGLEIKLEANETLAFGDTDMAVLPMFLRNDSTYGFYNKVFDSKGQNNHSLIFKIEGRSMKKDVTDDVDDGKKYISFLGDSISTYKGWSDNTSFNSSIGANATWYPKSDYPDSNMGVENTWWHKVYTELGYELAVNNSWSGSIVTSGQTYNVRSKNLHNTTSGAKPDIIVIFMGINDFNAGIYIGNYDGTKDAPNIPQSFSEAYGRLITNIKNAYKDAEIYCCTLLPDMKRLSSTKNEIGKELEDYNEAIKEIAENLDVGIIELDVDTGIDRSNLSKYTVDKLHPNSAGMELIAKVIIDAIK